MLLNLARRIRAARDDERGIALPTVLAVMAILLIIAFGVAAAANGAVTFTTGTRAEVQAHASADAAIDLVSTDLQNGKLDCSAPAVATNGSDPDDVALNYTAPVAYYDAAGHALNGCADPHGTFNMAAGTPAQAVVTATGSAATRGVGTPQSDTQTVIGIFGLSFATAAVDLDKAVFADSGYTLTNNTVITDATGQGKADVYSNGSVICKTQSAVQGTFYVQGNMTYNNGCKVQGSVWLGGVLTGDTSQPKISGDVMIAGSAAPPYPASVVNATWVGGSVVANGDVTVSGNGNQNYCSLSGRNGNVCGSVVSLQGGVTLSNSAFVGGSVDAYKSISFDSSNNNHLILGGNVVSTTGSLGVDFNAQAAQNWTTKMVGGFVAVSGTSGMPLKLISNAASSCAASSGFPRCSPANPPIPLGGLPAQLNFPTNSVVVPPPRESLPLVSSSATALAQWSGQTPPWDIKTVTGCDLSSAMSGTWTRRLIVVTGCTTPIAWAGKSFTLPGDLAIMSPSGFAVSNGLSFAPTSGTGSHQLMLIVPSDAQLANGTPLVTWQHNTIASDPSYVKPVCNGTNGYGSITLGTNLTVTGLSTFIYTPCTFTGSNTITGFTGQIYAGTATFGDNNTLAFQKMTVPSIGASDGGGALGALTVTETARFDAVG